MLNCKYTGDFMTKSMIICGVGGQGIILASDILSWLLFKSGYDVKKNEIHGMSQREGSVTSFIRFGDKVYSPMISEGEADYLLSFEKLEALRNLAYLRKNAVAVINNQEIHPTTVQLGLAKYPEGIETEFSGVTNQAYFVDALEAAKKVGNLKAVNVILLGVISKKLDMISPGLWEEAIRFFVKEKFIDLNLNAFEIGKSLI